MQIIAAKRPPRVAGGAAADPISWEKSAHAGKAGRPNYGPAKMRQLGMVTLGAVLKNGLLGGDLAENWIVVAHAARYIDSV